MTAASAMTEARTGDLHHGAPDLRMPSLGADMTHGTLVAWHVKAGDVVHRGDVVAEVETEKGVFDVDVRADGVVGELLVTTGTKVPVGTVLARMGAGVTIEAESIAERVATPAAPQPPTVVASPPTVAASPPTTAPPATPGALAGPRLRASPLARRIAAELGVELAVVTPTGEGGTIIRADVEHAAQLKGARAGIPAPPVAGAVPVVERVPGGTVPIAAEPVEAEARRLAMRRAIAAAVEKSKREIPHYYLSHDVDVQPAVRWLELQNATRDVDQRLLPAALFIKAVACAAREWPGFNGFWANGAFQASEDVHVGVAISLRGGGLIAPALHNADQRSLDDTMRALRDLVQRARAGGLRTSELTDSTITVTNLGDRGVHSVFGVIYPPQVAIVGFGVLAERPWAKDGMLGVRPVVTVSLAADHRASDGHRGAQFLTEIARRLATPEAL